MMWQHNVYYVCVTFSVVRYVGLTAGENLGTRFQRLSRPQDTWFCRGYHGKNPQ